MAAEQVKLIWLVALFISPVALALPVPSSSDPVLESYLKVIQKPEQSPCAFAMTLVGSGLATSSLVFAFLPNHLDAWGWFAITGIGVGTGLLVSTKFTLNAMTRNRDIWDYIDLVDYVTKRIESLDGAHYGMVNYDSFRKQVTEKLSRFDLSLLEEKGGDIAMLGYVLDFHQSLNIESLPRNPYSAAVRYVVRRMSGFGI